MGAASSSAGSVTPPLSSRRWPLWWGASAIWWTLSGIITTTTYAGMGGTTWARALQVGMVSAWLWVPQTVLALWLAERFPLDQRSWRRRLPLILAVALAVVVARAFVVIWTNGWFGWYETVPSVGSVLVTSVANNFFLFLQLVAVGHALVYGRRYRERDEQLARGELQQLKMQLHPHFLFNALNTVNAYVRSDPAIASQMIARLSELLRHALDSSGTQEVPLQERG